MSFGECIGQFISNCSMSFVIAINILTKMQKPPCKGAHADATDTQEIDDMFIFQLQRTILITSFTIFSAALGLAKFLILVDSVFFNPSL